MVQNCDLVENDPVQLGCISFQASFLPLFGITPMLGRNFLPEEDRPNGPPVVMISYGLWKGHYSGDPHILDRMINVDGNQVRVVGVLPKDFQFPTLEAADIVSPFAFDPAVQQTVNGGFGYPTRICAAQTRRQRRAGILADAASFQRRPQMVSSFGEKRNSSQYPDAARSRDARCAAGCVGSLWVCPCGFADFVRERSRFDDGTRSGEAARACGSCGDRR